MSTLVRAALPGLQWLPAVWRQRATWATVLRFGFFGPLVGGAPYVIFVFPIPFAYAIGGLPALFAGWLFASWYHRPGRVPGWGWRLLFGALSGAGAALASALVLVLATERPDWTFVWVIAVHGVPAATVMALLARPPRPPLHRSGEAGPRLAPT